MLESKQLLLNIKAAQKDIIAIGKRTDLSPDEKAKALYAFQRQLKGYEAKLLVALSKEKHGQTIN